MPVVLRSGEELSDDATVIVHLGAGERDNLLDKAINSYDDYRGVTGDGFGRFALSVYAAVRGHDVDEIVDALPWNQYGTCTAGEIRELFELWPTTIVDERGDAVDVLQDVHFDVILRGPAEVELEKEGKVFEDSELFGRVREGLGEEVDRFRQLFEPRRRR